MPRAKLIINFVLFQLGWLACVVGGATEWHWAGSFAVVLIVAYHLQGAYKILPELLLIISAMCIGLIWDSLLLRFGVLHFSNGMVFELLAPHWIIAMWALFATTFNVSMRWLRGKWGLALLLGAFGGPLSYLAGQKLGAVAMPNLPLALGVLAIGWALFMPFLLFLSSRFDGYAPFKKREHSL